MKVLLAFDDVSLGGTSRTAILFARLWSAAGATVSVYSARDPHPVRVAELDAAGVSHSTSLPRGEGAPNLVHLHHAAPSSATIRWVGDFLDEVGSDVVLLTHNVFGQDLPLAFPERTIVGVLGDWLGTQYRYQTAFRRKPVRVVPNPQDTDFFRPPTADERVSARNRLGIAPETRVILRVGSPTTEKWSSHAYRSLAERVHHERGYLLRLIGAPQSLTGGLPRSTYVRPQPISLDEDLRDEYWAADSFAHWAERGESFGNVILEALSTGLPVTYMARPTRDNTPAEFRSIEEFHYARTKAEWLASATSRFRSEKHPAKTDPSLLKYSSQSVEDTLRSIVHLSGRSSEALAQAVLAALPSPRRLRFKERALVGIRHNPLMASLKRIRLSLGS